jgi:hypothetical protein
MFAPGAVASASTASFCSTLNRRLPFGLRRRRRWRACLHQYGIECLQQIIADERTAGRAPPQVKPTE